jgi:DNA repair protein RadC
MQSLVKRLRHKIKGAFGVLFSSNLFRFLLTSLPPYVTVHHNFKSIIMESTNDKTLFEVAEIQLSYKSNLKPSLLPKISNSRDCVEIFRKIWDAGRIEFVEEFNVMLLNRANKVMGIYRVSSGVTTHTSVDIKGIFVAALLSNATSIILAHNHPSGNLAPSQPDIDLTRKAKEAGIFLEIPVLDHIIITSESFYSFADEGSL